MESLALAEFSLWPMERPMQAVTLQAMGTTVEQISVLQPGEGRCGLKEAAALHGAFREFKSAQAKIGTKLLLC